jgi:hypothetical protein
LLLGVALAALGSQARSQQGTAFDRLSTVRHEVTVTRSRGGQAADMPGASSVRGNSSANLLRPYASRSSIIVGTGGAAEAHLRNLGGKRFKGSTMAQKRNLGGKRFKGSTMAQNESGPPSLKEQVNAANAPSGSALARLIESNQDFTLLEPEEFHDDVPLPLWLRVYWRKAHPEIPHPKINLGAGYPDVLYDIFARILAHPDMRWAGVTGETGRGGR